ncbi:MAG: DMT family transporter [Geminicoccaceae bacterium]
MARGDTTLRAVGLFLLGGLFFVTLNSFAKTLLAELGPTMVLWARYFFHVVLVAVLFPGALARLPRAPQLPVQLGRSLMLMLSTVCNFLALRHMPLGDVSAIVFMTPILVAGLAVVVLKERVSLLRWLAIGAGLAGAMLVIRPGSSTFNIGAVLALLCALTYAVYQVSTRLVREGDAVVSLLYGGLGGLVVFTLILPFGWQTPSLLQWAMLVTMGAFGAVGHLLVILALQRMEASRLSPFSYLQLVWAMLISFFVFGDVPTFLTLTGAVVIVASGLWAWRLNMSEHLRGTSAALR